jgi:hypothetical protein
MRRLGIAGFLVVLSVSGCASMKGTATSEGPPAAQVPVPPDSAPQPIPPPASTTPNKVKSSTDNGSDQTSTPARTADTAVPPPPPPPPASPATPATPATPTGPAKAISSGGTRPVKQTGAAGAQTRPPVSSPAPPPPLPPSPASTPITSPTLNLADLEQRLRETRAIGVFTKLSLKNQVDDLLNAFRALYRGPNKHPPAELRQRYDLLLLKVLTLLQDGDPPLAAAISSSREAIWSILADPDKFAQI